MRDFNCGKYSKMMQINTMTNRNDHTNANSTVNAFSSDAEKMQLQEMTQEFLSNQEVQKRIRNMIGARGVRFNINIDELR